MSPGTCTRHHQNDVQTRTSARELECTMEESSLEPLPLHALLTSSGYRSGPLPQLQFDTMMRVSQFFLVLCLACLLSSTISSARQLQGAKSMAQSVYDVSYFTLSDCRGQCGLTCGRNAPSIYRGMGCCQLQSFWSCDGSQCKCTLIYKPRFGWCSC
jgi:hypothetical protein